MAKPVPRAFSAFKMVGGGAAKYSKNPEVFCHLKHDEKSLFHLSS